MNDEIELCNEQRKPTRHLATQLGCSCWAPIVPVATDAPGQAGEKAVTLKLAQSAAPALEKNPGLREITEVARLHLAFIRDSD